MKRLLFATACALALPLAAKDYYVNLIPSSVPGYDPTAELGSATNPFPTIHQATAASLSGYADNIYIANGHYHLSDLGQIPVTTDTRLIGESRDGVIIDGDGVTRCIKADWSSYGISIRNLTVTNGCLATTVKNDFDCNYGAGIWMDAGTISNCVVRGCLVRADAANLTIGGAALRCQSATTVRDSIIEYNVASNNYNNTASGSAQVSGGVVKDGKHYNCQLNFNRPYLNRGNGYNNFDGGVGNYGSWYGCTFTSNAVVSIAGTYCARGGALAYPSVVSNCWFIGNQGAGRGNAVCTTGKTYDSTFIGNFGSVTGSGAALQHEGGSVDGCWFEGNTARCTLDNEGKGVALGLKDSNMRVSNCVFYRNTCNSGNAILAAGVANNVISNCFFVENTDVASPSKDTCLIGTVGNQGHEIVVRSCVFMNNIGQSNKKFWGIKGTSVRGFEVHNCLFAQNKLVDAIYLSHWDNQNQKPEYYDGDETYFNSYVSNCTIVDNWLSGKAVWLFFSLSNNLHGFYDQFLRNCLIYGNYSDEAKTKFADSQLAYTENGIYSQPWAKATNFVVNCAIDSRMKNVANLTNETATTVYNNHDNIAISDPKFTDAASGDYSLLRGSPCIDGGTNMTWCATAKAMNRLVYEYDPAKPGVRVRYVRKPLPRTIGPATDIGAFEFRPKTGFLMMAR